MAGIEEAGLGVSFTVRQNDIPAQMTAAAQATKELDVQTLGLTTSQEKLTQMVQQGTITGEQYRAALEAQIKDDEALGFQLKEQVAPWAELADAETKATVAAQENVAVTEQATTRHQSMFTTMREGRYVMMAMVADMELMRVAQGADSQAVQEATKSLQSIIDTGLLAFMASGNPAIAVAAGLAAGFMDLAMVATGPTQEIQNLNKELDSLGKKDVTIQTLADLAGVTYQQAANAMQAAKENPEYAKSIDDLAKAAEPTNPLLKMMGDMAQWAGDRMGEAATAARDLALVVAGETDVAIVTLEKDLGLISQTEYQDTLRGIGQAMIDIRDGAKAADTDVKALHDKILNAPPTKEQTAQINKQAEAWQSYEDSVGRALRTEQEQLADNAFQRQQQEARTADQIATTERGLTDKLNDLAWQHEHQQEQADLESVRSNQNANDEIYRASRELALSLEEHDFSVAEQGYKAKTYSEYLEIERRGAFERGMIEQRGELQMDELTKRVSDEQKYAAQKKALDDEEYSHQRELAMRDTAERESDIRRQQALQDAASAHQEEVTKRRYADELADAKKRYDEELAKVTSTIAGQAAAAAGLQKQYLDDSMDRRRALVDEITLRQELANIPYGYGGTTGWTYNPFAAVTGAQHGANFIVPPGFNRDNFIVGVSSGERVNVTPAGAPSRAGAGDNYNFYGYDMDQVARKIVELLDARDRGRVG